MKWHEGGSTVQSSIQLSDLYEQIIMTTDKYILVDIMPIFLFSRKDRGVGEKVLNVLHEVTYDIETMRKEETSLKPADGE